VTGSRLEKTGCSGDTDVSETYKIHRATEAAMKGVRDPVRDMGAALGRSGTDMQGKRNDHRIFKAQ